MFPEELKQNVPPGGRISHFVQSWEKLTKVEEILEIVKGYKIPLLRTPVKDTSPGKNPLNKPLKENQKFVVEKEMKEIFGDGSNKESLATQRSACSKSISEQSFSYKEKRLGLPSGYKSENSESVSYIHFKVESLQALKYMLKERDYMCKIDFKDAYFTVPLDKSCRHLVRFLWEGNLYEFLCLCFGLGPSPRAFTKILKVPISLLRRLNIRILIYLDDMLSMSQSVERILLFCA